MPPRIARIFTAHAAVLATVLLLAFGGRVTTAVGQWLRAAPATAQAAGGGHEEEEEQRHAAKPGATVLAERAGGFVPLGRPAPAANVHGGRPQHRSVPGSARVLSHRDDDRRNGIGSPLRC